MSPAASPSRTPLPPEPVAADLAPTEFLDFEHPDLAEYAASLTEGLVSDVDRSAALFLAVRDGLRYDPFDLSADPADYRASRILHGSQRWCVSKAVLLAALNRAVGIPARLGFADVKNHLQTNKLAERMESDLFAWHGFAVMWIGGKWLKASPAFNRELCERFGTKVLEFDGRSDALLHSYDRAGNRHMEYVNDRGEYQDLPLEEILATFADIYPTMVSGAGTVHDEAFHGEAFHGDSPSAYDG